MILGQSGRCEPLKGVYDVLNEKVFKIEIEWSLELNGSAIITVIFFFDLKSSYNIHRNRAIHLEIIFSRILSVPNRRTSKRNFGSPKQIRESLKRESWLVFQEFVWGYQNSVWRSFDWGHSESATNLCVAFQQLT